MDELKQIREEQARCGDWLREHAGWRDSDDTVKRRAYEGALLGASDWLKAECLYHDDARKRTEREPNGRLPQDPVLGV